MTVTPFDGHVAPIHGPEGLSRAENCGLLS